MRDAKSKAWIVGAVLLGAISLGGCATKKFVREQVAVVDTKVDQTNTRVDGAEGSLRAHDAKLGELDKTSRDALERAMAAGKLAEGKFLYTVVLSDDSVKFPLDQSKLSPEADARLAQLASQLKAENKNVYLEVQGHTDATGDTAYNDRLGDNRAEAVRKFLSKQGVALSRMATISYGEAEPVAPNNTREGRAQNRRVAIVVLQ